MALPCDLECITWVYQYIIEELPVLVFQSARCTFYRPLAKALRDAIKGTEVLVTNKNV